MKIALCLIAYNEETYLRRCLESFDGLVDEIWVADTGSTDETVEIAVDCGAEILHYEKSREEIDENYFHYARARNFAQSKTMADVIFSIDCDEYLHPKSRDGFRETIEKLLKEAPTVLIPIWSGFDDETLESPSHAHRLVRCFNRDGSEWVYRIHELITGARGTQEASDIIILHEKAEKTHTREELEDRTVRYLQTMKLEERDHPENPRPLMYQATTLFESERFDEAVPAFYKYLDLAVWGEERAQSLLMLGKNYLALKEPKKALSCFFRSAVEDPRRAEPWFYAGDAANQMDRWDYAVGLYEICATYQNKEPKSLLFLESETYTWLPWYRLAMGYGKLHHLEKALDAAERVLEWQPEDKDMTRNAAAFREFLSADPPRPRPPEVPIIKPSPRPVNIIIPTKTAELFGRCLASIQDAITNVPYTITAIVNGKMRIQNGELPHVDFRPGPDPFIFAEAINRGIHGTSDIVILNDDTSVEDYWLDNMQGASYATDIPAITSPLITNVGNPRQAKSEKVGVLDGKKELVWRNVPDHLCFVCVYIPVEILTELGQLDEGFIWYGYEDNDYCWRAREKGFHLRVTELSTVQHQAHASFGQDIQERMAKAKEFFDDKWAGKEIPEMPDNFWMREVEEDTVPLMPADAVIESVHSSVVIQTFGDTEAITIDDGAEIRPFCYLEVQRGMIHLGKRAVLGAHSSIQGNGGVHIGDGTLIGPGCHIHSADHPDSPQRFVDADMFVAPVVIGKNVYIGSNVTILMGSTIGDDCIIGAGSVITRGTIIPDGARAWGSPCKVNSQRNIPRERQSGNLIEKSHVERYGFAVKYIQPGDVVLDAGCGVGYGSEIMARSREACKVIGVEISLSAFSQARARLPVNATAICSDLLIYKPDAPFNVVVAFEMLEHVEDSDAMLAHLWEMVRPGGILLFSVPSDKVSADANPFHHRHFSAHEARDMARKNPGLDGEIEIHNQKRGGSVEGEETPVEADYYIIVMKKERGKP